MVVVAVLEIVPHAQTLGLSILALSANAPAAIATSKMVETLLFLFSYLIVLIESKSYA